MKYRRQQTSRVEPVGGLSTSTTNVWQSVTDAMLDKAQLFEEVRETMHEELRLRAMAGAVAETIEKEEEAAKIEDLSRAINERRKEAAAARNEEVRTSSASQIAAKLTPKSQNRLLRQ